MPDALDELIKSMPRGLAAPAPVGGSSPPSGPAGQRSMYGADKTPKAEPTRVERPGPKTPVPPTALIPTLPESPATMAIQVQQLVEGQRRVVMIPKGTPSPAMGGLPHEVGLLSDGLGNTYLFRKDLISRAEIKQAARNNTLPEILGGPEGMQAPDKSALPPDPPVVKVHAPDGTEVQSTATDPMMLEQTLAASSSLVPSGGSLGVESPEQAIVGRQESVPPPQAEPGMQRPRATVAPILSKKKSGQELFRGAWDIPLNENGVAHAQKLAQRTAGKWSQIWASTRKRAGDTAAAVSRASPKAGAVRRRPFLDAMAQGANEGMPVTPERIAQLNDHIANRPDEPMPGMGMHSGKLGQSFNQFKDPLIEHVMSQIRNYRKGQRILNVTHYRDIRAVDAWLKAGAKPDRSLDIESMTAKGKEKPGDLYRLDGHAGQYVLVPAKDANAPGIYFARHGETMANEGAAGARGST